jgi:hypothetical protein
MSIREIPIKTTSVGDRIYFRMGEDLTGASLPRVSMKSRTTGAIKINAASAQFATGVHVIDGVSQTLALTDGWTYYQFTAPDLDTPDYYDMEPSVVTVQGKIVRPRNGYVRLWVQASI